MNSKSLKSSLMIVCFVMSFITSVTIAAISIYNIKSMTNLANTDYRNAMNDGYRNEIRSQVQSVLTILQAEYDKSQSGVITEKEAQDNAKEIVRAIRYGDKADGYLWIDGTDYTLIMHPILPKNEGTNRFDLKDKNGVMIIQEIMKVVTGAKQGGYNQFYFTKADGVTIAPKIAYSQLFKPWGWVISTGNYVDEMETTMQKVQKQISSKFVYMCVIISIVGLILATLALFFSRIIGKVIVTPLVEIQTFATRISEGDLTRPLLLKERNEIGMTASALNNAQANITELISSIGNAANDIETAIAEFNNSFIKMSTSIQEVSGAVTGIAENINGQAAYTGNVSESVNIIAGGIGNTSRVVKELDLNSQNMKELNKKSVNALNELIMVNNQTKEDIGVMYSQTELTNQSVQRIRQAAELINTLSSQTNLLSLNASIEAARAGEAGKGFAVVAQEIGNLAFQSSSAVKEIGNVINEVLLNSNKSVNIMHGMNSTIEQQVKTLNDTNKIFNSLHGEIDKCIISITVISNMIEDTNKQRDNVTDNLSTLSSLAQDNAAATEEASTMSEELSDIVNTSNKTVELLSKDVAILMQNVKKFKI